MTVSVEVIKNAYKWTVHDCVYRDVSIGWITKI